MCRIIVVCACLYLPFGFPSDVGEGFNTFVSKESFNGKEFVVHLKDLRPHSRNLSRIVGGQEAVPHSYPSVVALIISEGKGNFHRCGGSLLSNRWVLTAAHCVSTNPDYIGVLLGAHDLNRTAEYGRVILRSTHYLWHEHYNETSSWNDVALVMLPKEVTYNQYIQPVRLAKGPGFYVDDTGTAVGWGRTDENTSTSALRSVQTNVMSNDACSKEHVVLQMLLKSTHLCTKGPGNVSVCFGDSGGPLFVDGVQVGIAAFVIEGCKDKPSVFMRVSSFHDWIMRNAVGGATDYNSVKLDAIVLATLCFVQFLK